MKLVEPVSMKRNLNKRFLSELSADKVDVQHDYIDINSYFYRNSHLLFTS